jgi:hypothetical protein
LPFFDSFENVGYVRFLKEPQIFNIPRGVAWNMRS